MKWEEHMHTSSCSAGSLLELLGFAISDQNLGKWTWEQWGLGTLLEWKASYLAAYTVGKFRKKALREEKNLYL